MLAIQCVRMCWEKDSRSPQGAVKRREYFRPHRIPDEVSLKSDKNVFVQRLSFYQEGGGDVFTEDKYVRGIYYYPRGEPIHPDFDTHFAHKQNMRIAKIRDNNMGMWYDDVSEFVIPSVEIFECDGGYEVYWHYIDKPGYNPFRKGYNINYDRQGSRVKGRRLKCERAFILGMGEAGVLRFNYRVAHSMTGFEGQHYEQYSIYIVNAEKAAGNIFTSAEYTKEYDEMAHLF